MTDTTGFVTPAGYPPPVHLLRDLNLEVQHGGDVSRAWLPVTEHVCNEAGQVRTGVITVLVDAISGGLAAATAAPDWIATADLTLHLTRPVVATELEAVARVERAGRTTIVLEATVLGDTTRGDREPVAVATVTFGVLPRRDDNPVMTQLSEVGDEPRRPFFDGNGGFTGDAYEAIGLVDLGGGTVELTMSEYLVNSIGGLQGGVFGALVDASARSALGPGFELADLHLVYLALGRRGPIRATTDVWVQGDDHATVSVDVHDLGAGRRTTVATGSAVKWVQA